GVADAGAGLHRDFGEHGFEGADLALGPAAFGVAGDESGHPGRIVAAIFQTLEAFDQPPGYGLVADDANDAAHDRMFRLSRDRLNQRNLGGCFITPYRNPT